MKSIRRSIVTFALLALLVAGGAVLFGAPATAGDNVGLVDFHPSGGEVEPGEAIIMEASAGETVVIEATLRSDGGYGSEGIKSVNKTVAYDPEVLTLTDVERGPWLQQGNETDLVVSSSIDDDTGRVTVEQVRSPVDGGAVGEGTTMVMTFEVAGDAPPSDAYLQYETVDLVLETGVPVNDIARERAVRIDGGGEERIPIADDDDDGGPGIVTPEDDPGNGDPDDTETAGAGTDDSASEDDESTDIEPDDQAGFGASIAVFAFALAFVLSRQIL